MVYTVTFNPALDYVVFADDVRLGAVNRIRREVLDIGGKGINVSVVLSELGIKSKALGFVAGFVGDEIERRVRERGIETDFIHLESGISRINIKLKTRNETDLNANGPDIPGSAVSDLVMKFHDIADGDVLVLAGSVPNSLPSDMYQQILEYVAGKNIKTFVDASGELLTNTLQYRPFLIKPNLDELAEIFGERPSSREEILSYAKQLQEMGAQNVLVSMAGDGAILLDSSGEVYYCAACEGKAINSVGAGDAMVAGFIAGSIDNDVDNEYSLMLATAAGGATAFSDGLAVKSDIIELMKQLLKKNAG